MMRSDLVLVFLWLLCFLTPIRNSGFGAEVGKKIADKQLASQDVPQTICDDWYQRRAELEKLQASQELEPQQLKNRLIQKLKDENDIIDSVLRESKGEVGISA